MEQTLCKTLACWEGSNYGKVKEKVEQNSDEKNFVRVRCLKQSSKEEKVTFWTRKHGK